MKNELEDTDIFVTRLRTTGSDFIRCASFSPCGRFLAVASKLKPPKIYDLVVKKALRCQLDKPADCLAFHPRWAEFMFGYADGVRYAERFNLPLRMRFQLPFRRTTAIAYSAGGRYLAAGDSLGFVSVLDLEAEPHPKEIFYRHVGNANITAVAVSDEPAVLIAVPAGRIPIEFSLDTQKQCLCLKRDLAREQNWDCYAVALSANAQYTAFGGNGGTVYLKDFLHGHARSFQTGLELIRQLVFSPDKSRLIVVGTKSIEFWSIRPTQLCYRWDSPHERILSIGNFEIEREDTWSYQLLIALEERR